jgi:hypothetical protein
MREPEAARLAVAAHYGLPAPQSHEGLPVGPGSPGDLAGGPAGCRPGGLATMRRVRSSIALVQTMGRSQSSAHRTVRRVLGALEAADSRLRREITTIFGARTHPDGDPRTTDDPRLKALVDAHYRVRWRTALASLLDVFLCAAVAFGAAVVVGTHLGISHEDKTFVFLFLAAWVPTYLAAVYGSLRRHAASPGMRLLGIVAVSPRTCRPAGPHEARPPTKWDYRRDRLPGLLFLPRQDLG